MLKKWVRENFRVLRDEVKKLRLARALSSNVFFKFKMPMLRSLNLPQYKPLMRIFFKTFTRRENGGIHPASKYLCKSPCCL